MFEIRRSPRVVVLLASSLLFMTCASWSAPGRGNALAPNRAGGPCAAKKGNGSPNKPIVCVDDTGATLSVHPDPVIVHDVDASEKKPVVIQWMTVSGGNDLQISMKDGCTTALSCKGGKCTARTLPHGENETGERRCKYDIWTDKHPRLDPDTVVVKCCTVPEPTP